MGIKRITIILVLPLVLALLQIQMLPVANAYQVSCNQSFPLFISNGLIGLYNFDQGPTSAVATNVLDNHGINGVFPNFQVIGTAGGNYNYWCPDSNGICFTSNRPNHTLGVQTVGNISSTTASMLNSAFTIQIWFTTAQANNLKNGILWSLGNWMTSSAVGQTCPTTNNQIVALRTSPNGGLDSPYNLQTTNRSHTLPNTHCLSTTVNVLEDPNDLIVFTILYSSTTQPNLEVAVNGNFQQVTSFSQALFSTATNLVMGANTLLGTSQWDGTIFRLAIYNRTLPHSQVINNQRVAFDPSPLYGSNVYLNINQGHMSATVFNFSVTTYDASVTGCGLQDYSVTVWTIPQRGYLLLWDGNGGWNVLGTVPFTIQHAKNFPVAFVPSFAKDFSSTYANFTYSPNNQGSAPPSTRPPNFATVFVNLHQILLPPIAISQTINSFAGVTINNIFLNGTNPNPPFPNGTAYGAITIGYILTLPVLGTLRIVGHPHALTVQDLPANTTSRLVIYSSSPPDPGFSGQAFIGQDSFQFTVSNGVSSSVLPGIITINLQNPLVQQPSQNSTVEVRTTVRSFLNIQGKNLAQPPSQVLFKILTLPNIGTLLAFTGSAFVPISLRNTSGNGSAIIVILPSSAIYYRPFSTVAGDDSFLFQVVNATNGFLGSIAKLTIFINNPSIWIAPTNQPIGLHTCTTSPCTAAYFQMTNVNGDQNTLASGFKVEMMVNNLLGQISLSHPELYGNATFLLGSPSGGAGWIIFESTRQVANLLMQNISFSSIFIGNLFITFTSSDTENNTLYSTSSKVLFTVFGPPLPSISAVVLPPWVIGLIIAAVVLVAACCLYGIISVASFAYNLARNISYKKKHIKREKKLDKVEKGQHKTLIKQQKKLDKLDKEHKTVDEKYQALQKTSKSQSKSLKKTESEAKKTQKELTKTQKELKAQTRETKQATNEANKASKEAREAKESNANANANAKATSSKSSKSKSKSSSTKSTSRSASSTHNTNPSPNPTPQQFQPFQPQSQQFQQFQQPQTFGYQPLTQPQLATQIPPTIQPGQVQIQQPFTSTPVIP